MVTPAPHSGSADYTVGERGALVADHVNTEAVGQEREGVVLHPRRPGKVPQHYHAHPGSGAAVGGAHLKHQD